MHAPRLFVALVLGAGLIVANGCSDDSGFTPDAAVVYPDLQPLDLGGSCGPEVYPCGAYGTANGAVAADEQFRGYQDPDNFCKDHNSKQLDSGAIKTISFADWFKKPSACGKKYKLVWINVAAGWCGPCRAEVQELTKRFKDGTFPAQVDFLNIVFEDSLRKPASEAFAKTWATSQKLNWPVVADPGFKMGKYFDKAATPFNMLVNTETMEIVYQTVGANIPAIEAEITKFLSK
jgi:thiol-disulfide isomerase/thioredoxin